MTVPTMNLAATYSKADDKARAKRAADGSYGVLLTRITGAWRRTFTKMEPSLDPTEKPERKVEHDTGFFAQIAPVGFFLLHCDNDKCGRSAEQLAAFRASPWSVTLETDGRKFDVKCSGGTCSAKVKK